MVGFAVVFASDQFITKLCIPPVSMKGIFKWFVYSTIPKDEGFMTVICDKVFSTRCFNMAVEEMYARHSVFSYPLEILTEPMRQVVRASLSVKTPANKFPRVRKYFQISFSKQRCATSVMNGSGFLQVVLTANRNKFSLADLPIATPTKTEEFLLFHSSCVINYLMYAKNCTRKSRTLLGFYLDSQCKVFVNRSMLYLNLRITMPSQMNFTCT